MDKGFKKLSDLFAGDQELIVSVLSIAKKQLQSFHKDLASAVEQEDLEALHFIGHKLYGTAATIGMDDLAALAKVAEHLKKHDNVQELGNRISDEVENALTRISLQYPDV